MNKRITIDPITRLEGHGKIEIFLDEKGDVEKAYFQVPELRGFEVFSVGRPAEEMPRITPKICGVCPTAHHICSTKALDDLFKVEPTPVAKKLRELMYSAFMLEDHTLHFFFLGGPDFFIHQHPRLKEYPGVIAGEWRSRKSNQKKKCRDIITSAVVIPLSVVCQVASPNPIEDEAEDCSKRALNRSIRIKMFEDVVLKKWFILIVWERGMSYYMGMVDKDKCTMARDIRVGDA
jgi:F420-non-reducing hydrogenase large subunit